MDTNKRELAYGPEPLISENVARIFESFVAQTKEELFLRKLHWLELHNSERKRFILERVHTPEDVERLLLSNRTRAMPRVAVRCEVCRADSGHRFPAEVLLELAKENKRFLCRACGVA